MANRYFGNIADVWKHLALVEVLEQEAPAGYAETHAGSGAYAVVRDAEREFGLLRFLEVASKFPVLANRDTAQAVAAPSRPALTGTSSLHGSYRPPPIAARPRRGNVRVPELPVTPLEQVPGSRLEGLGTEQLEGERVGKPVGDAERGADRERIPDLLRGDTS
jgi:hypothetical protein